MFIGRESEIKQLNRFYMSSSFEMLIVYGRRRVGKTKLLTEFIKDKKAIFFVAEENNDLLNKSKFQRTVLTFFDENLGMNFDYWEDIFRYICSRISDERLMIVIDELPYLAAGNPSFLSMLQNVIDHHLIDKNVFLILCGSSISFMEDEIVAHKSPLYGRKTGQIKVRPFDFFDVARFFPTYSIQDRFRVYSVLGGIPHYLIRIKADKTVDENIIDLFFQSSSFLYDEPRNLLHQELRSPMVYNAIVEAVAGGASKINEITTKIGEVQGKTSKYIKSLIELELIERRQPVTAEKSNKSLYRVADNLFNYLYRYVYTNRGLVEQELGASLYYQKIKNAMENLYGQIFEDVCRQYLIRKNTSMELDFLVEKFGTWWGGNPVTKKQEELDIVGLSEDYGLFCECKYRNELTGIEVYEKLLGRSHLIPREKSSYYIFSKSGFTERLIDMAASRNDLHLITLDQMFEDILAR